MIKDTIIFIVMIIVASVSAVLICLGIGYAREDDWFSRHKLLTKAEEDRHAKVCIYEYVCLISGILFFIVGSLVIYNMCYGG